MSTSDPSKTSTVIYGVSPKYSYLDKAQEISPDWKQVFTLPEAVRELGYEFKEPGWYFFKGDTILMLPFPVVEDGVEKFYFYVYNGRNPVNGFNQISSAPVRRDDRE